MDFRKDVAEDLIKSAVKLLDGRLEIVEIVLNDTDKFREAFYPKKDKTTEPRDLMQMAREIARNEVRMKHRAIDLPAAGDALILKNENEDKNLVVLIIEYKGEYSVARVDNGHVLDDPTLWCSGVGELIDKLQKKYEVSVVEDGN